MLLALAALVATSCGPRETSRPAQGGRLLRAYGVSVTLPHGWTGRILLGDEGRPVLHAANFALSAVDTDTGMIAREIGGEMYVNVRDLGVGESKDGLPVDLSASDFESLDGRLLEAHRDVGDWRVTVVSGRDPPVQRALTEANELLAAMSVEPYIPVPIPPLPKDADRIEGYGISMRLPAGWRGEVTRGKLEAEAPEGKLRLRLIEHGGTDVPFRSPFPFELSQAEFVADTGRQAVGTAGRGISVHGRDFAVWAEAGELTPSAEVVEEANQALASLRVQAGDFYPGSVEPATFAAEDGWHTGTTGRAEAEPGGQQTWTWASTIPYRDEPMQFPPHKTLERLDRDGIIVNVMLFGPARRSDTNALGPPFRLDQATRSGFPGLPENVHVYSILGRLPGQQYDVEVTIIFGRARPTRQQIAAADAELGRLRLPDWSATD